MITGDTAHGRIRSDGTMLDEHETYGTTPTQRRELDHLLFEMRSESPADRPAVANVIASLDRILDDRDQHESEKNSDEEVPSYTLRRKNS